jgi:hypothetical protein
MDIALRVEPVVEHHSLIPSLHSGSVVTRDTGHGTAGGPPVHICEGC